MSVTGTVYQKYTLAQLSQVTILIAQLQGVSAGASIRMGIYNDGGTYPSNLIYATQLVGAYNGINGIYTGADNVNLGPGTYWLAVDYVSGSAAVTGSGSGVTPALIILNGYDMPNPFPSALNPPIDTLNKLYLSAYINTCNPAATTTPLPTDTPVPTLTFTPTPASTPVTISYVNSAATCAGTFGCSISFVNACRALNLDITTLYIMMRLGATCGCQPSDIMTLRLTMSWDEICTHYGLDWTTFTTDLQTRINTLQPEINTPNQLIRGAANDPSSIPISNPDSMPDTLTTGITSKEACPLCQ